MIRLSAEISRAGSFIGSAGCNYEDMLEGKDFDFGGGRAYLRDEMECLGSCGIAGSKNTIYVYIRSDEAEKKVKVDFYEIEKYGDTERKKRTEVKNYSDIHHIPCEPGDIFEVKVIKEDDSSERQQIGYRKFVIGSL